MAILTTTATATRQTAIFDVLRARPSFRRPVSEGASLGPAASAPSPAALERASGPIVPVDEPASYGPSKVVLVAAGVVGVALVGFVAYRLRRKR